jgi:parallel beta-helix repeat protein
VRTKFVGGVLLSILLVASLISLPSFIITITSQTASANSSSENFTIVALPDTQYYSEAWPLIFENQTNWIVQNENAQNIVFVTHLGDIVDWYPDNNQWQNANIAMSILDNKVPYTVIPGAPHDMPSNTSAPDYEKYFPASRFEGYSYWGGSYDPSPSTSSSPNMNNYQLFSWGGMNFITLSLQYNPPADVLSWADNVLDNYKNRRAIISTHSYLNPDNTLTSDGGQNIHDSVVVQENSVFLVLCGHQVGSNGLGEAERIETIGNRTVYQLLSDYQAIDNGGFGYLRIIEFVPSENTIYVKTYSPWLDNYMTGPSSQFELSYPMTVGVSVSPTSQEGFRGDNLKYAVTVTNNEKVSDNFKFTVSDNDGWGPIISRASLVVDPFSSDNTTTLSVIVPPGAVDGTIDAIKVTATSQNDNRMSDSASCTAHVTIIRGFSVSISPRSQSGENGATLTYTVTVNNIGIGSDNYFLTDNDNAEWSLSVLPTSLLNVSPGTSWNATLSVTLGIGTDTITVHVTNDNTTGEATCAARGLPIYVSLTPSVQYGRTGENLAYTIVVKNLENIADNFQLTLADNNTWQSGWNAPAQAIKYASTEINDIQDTYVHQYYPTYNYGRGSNNYMMYVGVENHSDTGYCENIYAQWDLNSLPANAVIDNAYVWMVGQFGPEGPSSQNYPPDNIWVEAWNVENDTWSENVITWNNAPGIGPSLLDNELWIGHNWAGYFVWESWNVTSWVRNQFENGKLVSFAFTSNGVGTDGVPYILGYFYTKDGFEAGAYAPYMTVNYHIPPGLADNTLSLGPGENWTGTVWVITGASGVDGKTVTATSMTNPTISVSATAQASPENTIKIVILHTNDIHGYLDNQGVNGGMAYLASVVDNERAQNPGRVLLLDAGDIVDGDPIGDLFYGRSVIEVMNAMGYDVMTIGDHDLAKYGGNYNYGVISIENDYVMDLKEIAKFPMLAANVRINNLDNSKQFAPYVIKEIDNVKIGIIGIVSPYVCLAVPPENMQVSDPENAVRQCINEIENQVDIIIALTHLGLYPYLGPVGDNNLASDVENIDIIIGGHSHTVMENSLTVGKTEIVQAGCHGDYVGRIELDINAENHENYTFQYNLIPVTHPSLVENQVIAEMLDNYNSIISPIVDVKIGYTENALSKPKLGKEMAESYRESTGADVAIGISGNIREDHIPAGPITIRQFYKVFPWYFNKLMLMDLRGDNLKDELGQEGVYWAGAYKENSQWYLENGELIQDNENYRVAVDEFVGKYGIFLNGTNITYHGLIQDAFINELKEDFPFSIYINGNENFTAANGVSGGSGTENDPYIIEYWDINADNTNGIEIVDTTDYFVIRNCYVHDGSSSYYAGIFFDNVKNGTVNNNIVENNSAGICLWLSDNNTFSGNTVIKNYYGVYLENALSNNNTFSGNTVVNNSHGIWLAYSFNNIISGNTVQNNSQNGFWLDDCENNIISGNTVQNNHTYGFNLNYQTKNNIICHNNIINNTNQAYDTGSDNWDNGYPSGGNYWSDYTGPDNCSGENQNISGNDGIGDNVYIIPGGNNKDRYPLLNPWYETIVRGKDTTSYNVDHTGDAPWVWYAQSDRPPIMAAKRVGSGAVLAAGTAATCCGGTTYPAPQRWVSGEWDVLLDKAFQWMVPGATKVLWYQGYGVYCNTSMCSNLVTALTDKGYTITGDSTEPITSSLLAPYDILVIPTLELGASGTGGDPNLLPDADVQAIKGFVEEGGGLLIMDQTDYSGFNYYQVQNKILRALNMGIYFQSDEIYDDANYWGDGPWSPIADINTGGEIGAAYQTATRKKDVKLFNVCTLAELGHGVSFSPSYQEGLQGWTLKYTVKILNMSGENNTYTLAVSDDENWGPWLEDNLLTVPTWEIGSVAMAITIPPEAGMGAEDRIFVTATSAENVEKSYWCISHVGAKLLPTDDATAEEGYPTGNFGGTNWLYVGPGPGPYLDERTFLKFDLSGIPAGIVSAKLYLYCFNSYGFVPENQRNLQVRSVDNDDWNEMTITWDDQPSYENTLDTCLVPAGNAWCSWDVTSFVQEQHITDNFLSFCLRAENEDLIDPDYFACGFRSKEYGVVAQRPYLELWMGATPTPTGENVQVTTMPGTTITFARVENSGITTVTTSTAGPPPPTAYEIVGIAGQPIYYDYTTTAIYSGLINMCISYDETQVRGAENDLRLIHEVDNIWVDITTSVDTENNKIYGTTTTLSTFIVVEPLGSATLELVAGWNLVGFPVTNENTTPDNLFFDQTYYIWKWDADNKKYVSPHSSAPVEFGVGYWIWVDHNQTLTTSGVPVDTYSENLKNGWNLVGFPVTSPATTPANLFAGQTYYIWKWDAVNRKYTPPSSTAPVELGVGYWIWTDHDQTVTVPL